MIKIIANFVICLFFLIGCSAQEKKDIPNANIGEPFAVNSNLQINVLSYKFISIVNSPDQLVYPPPEGKKYIVLRVFWQNMAKHRGIPSFMIRKAISSIKLLHARLANPADIYYETLYSSIEPFTKMENKELSAGESTTTWIIGAVPKDLTPPFLIKFTPEQGREMILDVK